jgi:hypothetical protein
MAMIKVGGVEVEVEEISSMGWKPPDEGGWLTKLHLITGRVVTLFTPEYLNVTLLTWDDVPVAYSTRNRVLAVSSAQ